jgi:hypothetical protein
MKVLLLRELNFTRSRLDHGIRGQTRVAWRSCLVLGSACFVPVSVFF